MEKNNKNKDLMVLVVILTVLVLGLGSFIFYDKVLSKKTEDIDNTENTKNITEIFKSLPQKNDNTVLWNGSAHRLVENYIDFNTNFKDISKAEYGFDLSYSCVEYGAQSNDESVDKCTKFEIYINKKQNNLYSDFWYGLNVMITSKYFIVYDGGFEGDLRIFDKLGDEIYTEHIATEFGIKADEENSNNEINGYTPSIKDGKLYFVIYLGENEFVVSSFDLDTKKVEKLSTFKGEIGLAA